MTVKTQVLTLGLAVLAGCGSGPNIFTELGKSYWRPEDFVCPRGEETCADGKWKTNWTIWYSTEQECLESISETQRCRKTWQ